MVFLAFGSNLGNRFENFRTALSKISTFFDCKIMSHVIETEALLLDGSPESWNIPYLNMVIAGESSVEPMDLLLRLKSVETEMGRDMNAPPWSPRIIDLDIVDYYGKSISSEKLTIPHIGIKDRDFLQFVLTEINYKIPNEIKLNLDGYAPMNHYVINPKFVGIVNVTPDSFSDGGDFFDADKAAAQANKLYKEGACLIELGAQSTRPGYKEVSAAEEIDRLDPALERCQNINCMGIDSYFDEVILHVMQKYNVKWINDQKAQISDKTIKKIADCNAKLIIMLHDMDIQWLFDRKKYLKNLGIKQENIIVDPGIGFGKSKYENITMLKNIDRVKDIGCEVLIGHSRKSFMTLFTSAPAKNRDIETISISNIIADANVDYIRIHDVKDHMRFFAAKHCVNTYNS